MAELTSHKAGIMLREGEIKGKPLTPAQKRFFGWVRGGRKNPKGRVATKLRKRNGE